MKTVIIGSGNIATVLGEKISGSGHDIRQVFARREGPAAALADILKCPWTSSWADIDRSADLYLVAISDSALTGLGDALRLPGKLVVHTAGAVSAGALASVSERCGVVWPLQSLRADIRPVPTVPLVIDARRSEDLPAIEAFALTLSDRVERAADAARLKLHLAAVLVNNFTNYLYTLTAGFCRREQLDFGLLLPLIRETAERLNRYPSETTQTGPAIRGDRSILEKHIKQLDSYQNIRQLYELFTIQIEGHYHDEHIGKI